MASPYYFEATRYWSQGDENAHFAWMERIPCIRGVQGELRKIFLDIDESRVTAHDIEELKAVYRRYGGELAQLHRLAATLETE